MFASLGRAERMIFDGLLWKTPEQPNTACTSANLRMYGYLGVRREAEPVNQAEKAEDDLEAARDAKQELSMCRKPAEFERWAIKWGPVLCQMLGAR